MMVLVKHVTPSGVTTMLQYRPEDVPESMGEDPPANTLSQTKVRTPKTSQKGKVETK